MVDGDARIERIDWDNFNEGLTLQEAVERVLGAIWILSRSSAGRQTVSHTSKLAVLQSARHPTSGRKLGRPAKDDEPTHKQIERQDAPERNAIEGKFGEGMRNGLGLIRDTAQGDQRERGHDAVLVMNLERRLRLLFVFIHMVTQERFTERNLFCKQTLQQARTRIALAIATPVSPNSARITSHRTLSYRHSYPPWTVRIRSCPLLLNIVGTRNVPLETELSQA